MATGVVRIYIGGLAPDVHANEIHERFGRIATASTCVLKSVEVLQDRLLPDQGRGFAYVTIEGTRAQEVLEQVIKAYHRTKWRGSMLHVALAKPDYRARLETEWALVKESRDATKAAAEAERLRLMPSMNGEGNNRQVSVNTGVAFEGKRRTSFEYVVTDDESEELPPDCGNNNPIEADSTGSESSDSGDKGSSDSECSSGSEHDEDLVENLESNVSVTNKISHSHLDSGDANARRLAALQEKIKRKTDDVAKVKGYVGKIDVVATTSSKITFSDDDNDENETNEKVTDWMSDSESDENTHESYAELNDEQVLSQANTAKNMNHKLRTLDFDDEVEGERQDWFDIRPEFLGAKGKQLFELQKRFGGDQRFRMDARFIEDEENEFGGNQDLEENEFNEEDEISIRVFQDEDDDSVLAQHSREMTVELDRALDVVGQVFPDLDIDRIRSRIEMKKRQDPIKEASWMGQMMRYDPRDTGTSKYVITFEASKKAANSKENIEGELNEAGKEKRSREEKELLIGGDRYYSTSSALGSLFTRVRKNSEDGIAGEAALDGVFGGFVQTTAPHDDSWATDGVSAPSTFNFSALFDAEFEQDKSKTLAAMGEELLEGDDDNAEKKGDPWHFTQSYMQDDDHAETDKEENEDDNDEENEEDEGLNHNKSKVVMKRNLVDFLAFGQTFLAQERNPEEQDKWQKEWMERRKKLTLDYKRKRRDAQKSKKRIQQHHNKRQKIHR